MKYKKGCQCQVPNLADIYMDMFGYKDNGYFVEVGAWDGVQWSNTSGLLDAGWTGVYFEPQPEIFDRLVANHGENSNAILINKALSDYVGVADLYLGGSISTIHAETRDNYLKAGAFAQTGLASEEAIAVPVSSLDVELGGLETPFGFEVLVIDVEGSEMDVLNGFSIHEYQPRMAIIETHALYPDEAIAAKSDDINEYMEDYGYKVIYADHINSIYLKEPT